MSHQIAFESLYEKLVLLEHFALGSQTYCALRLIGSKEDQGDGLIDEYWGWLKGIVSSHLIESAVRMRIFQDTLQGEDRRKLADIDVRARSGLRVGIIVIGSFELSLRETCNKIIHANRAIPNWEIGTEGGVEFKYWNGDYRLSGTNRDTPWEVVLHVAPWARAMARLLDEAESTELTMYVGQDWYGPDKGAS